MTNLESWPAKIVAGTAALSLGTAAFLSLNINNEAAAAGNTMVGAEAGWGCDGEYSVDIVVYNEGVGDTYSVTGAFPKQEATVDVLGGAYFPLGNDSSLEDTIATVTQSNEQGVIGSQQVKLDCLPNDTTTTTTLPEATTTTTVPEATTTTTTTTVPQETTTTTTTVPQETTTTTTTTVPEEETTTTTSTTVVDTTAPQTTVTVPRTTTAPATTEQAPATTAAPAPKAQPTAPAAPAVVAQPHYTG